MIDNLFDVLYVAKTGKIKPDASLTDNLYGKKFYDAHSGVITTATGNPVSIVTNKAQNAISTILSYSPKQSGSGDPSPSNVRPIEGWTEANLHVNEATITESLGGTYYGFEIDVERGVLRVTHATIAYDGDEAWNYSENGGKRRVFIVLDRAKPSSNDFWSNIASGGADSSYPDPWKMRTNGNARPSLIIGVDNTIGSLNDWKALLADTNMIVVYPLAEPLELPLTPQTVALLAGNNTIWCDGDEVSVTYKAKKA